MKMKPKQKFKALISDVDGTLVINQKEALPTERVMNAIKEARKKVHVGIATARCVPNIKKILDYVNFSGPLILQGGACIFDAEKKTIISEHILEKTELQKIQSIIKKYKVPFVFCNNQTDHERFSSIKLPNDKVFMVFAEGVSAEISSHLVNELSTLSTVAVHTTPSWTKEKTDILISNTSATKQHGIFEVAKILQINPHEIIGIGDGGNDFPLLMACGLKVAMGNANDDLKAIADVVAPTVQDDGVAWVIENYIL